MVRPLSGVLLFAALAAVSPAQEMKLTSAQVPPAVSSAAAQRFPRAKLANWSKETEDGKTTFEVSVVDVSGKRDAVFSPDGTLVATETPMRVNALPGPVESAIQAKYPGARVSKAEKITLATGEVRYEIDLLKAAKKEVLLGAGGKILKEE